ncbi:MAG: M50 family metallopeptidase [Promethearchaeota archaeon]
MKDTRFTRKISSFIYIIRDNLFKLDKRIDRIISLIMIFVLFYIVGFLSLFTHEFGHAMVNIIFNKYFERIELTINLQGLTYGAGSVILNTTQKTIAYLAGMISETLFALTVLIILLIKKEKNKFTWFLSITISMLFLNRVALYFTFSQLLGIPSDTFDMVINLGYDPWILFLIFLPYLMITFEITFQMMKKFSKNALRGEKDFLSVFVLGLISYIVFLIIFTPADPFSTQNFIYIFY